MSRESFNRPIEAGTAGMAQAIPLSQDNNNMRIIIFFCIYTTEITTCNSHDSEKGKHIASLLTTTTDSHASS